MTLAKRTHERPRLTTAIAEFYPAQGQWGEDDYLDAAETNRLVELSDGNLELIDMPTDPHQRLVGQLYFFIRLFLETHKLGTVNIAPLPVRLWPGKMREPDLMFMKKAHLNRIEVEFWGVPDFVVEVLSPGTRRLDCVTKKREYAQAGIPEYWIVDPDDKLVEVFHLQDDAYRAGGKFSPGDTLTSSQLTGFALDVSTLFAG